jgi:antirestriction protein ArdC
VRASRSLDDQGKRERVPILRYYAVFNLDQTEGIDPTKLPARDPEPEIVPDAETVVAGYESRPAIEHRAQPRAFYRPATDTVTLPPRSAFRDARAYYTTLFHELTHSTGHAKRLGRPGFERNHAAPFGSADYAREELVAELGAAFLCGESGLEPDIPAVGVVHRQLAPGSLEGLAPRRHRGAAGSARRGLHPRSPEEQTLEEGAERAQAFFPGAPAFNARVP